MDLHPFDTEFVLTHPGHPNATDRHEPESFRNLDGSQQPARQVYDQPRAPGERT